MNSKLNQNTLDVKLLLKVTGGRGGGAVVIPKKQISKTFSQQQKS